MGLLSALLAFAGGELIICNHKYVKFDETFYQPIEENGNSVRRVVTIEPDK